MSVKYKAQSGQKYDSLKNDLSSYQYSNLAWQVNGMAVAKLMQQFITVWLKGIILWLVFITEQWTTVRASGAIYYFILDMTLINLYSIHVFPLPTSRS